jgi:glutamyl-tRNA synthetase
LRFRIPNSQEIKFNDLVRGEQIFNSNDIGDFIIRRADGTSPFMFCSALDDSLMGITHILRGEDHLTNTPRQIMILQALDLPVPQYGHISLILGDDGSPLSKRNGSRSMHELRNQGFLPAALVNYLARLGHHYDNDKLMDLDELSGQFSAPALSHSPAKFDYNQLLHWQKQAVINLVQEEFCDWMGPETKQIIPDAILKIFINIIQHNVLFPEEIKHWAKILCTDGFAFTDEQKAIIKDAGALFFHTALSVFKKHGTNFNAFTGALSEALSIKGKALYMPLRIALTGERHGPELAHIFEILGKEKIQSRFELATTVLHHS